MDKGFSFHQNVGCAGAVTGCCGGGEQSGGGSKYTSIQAYPHRLRQLVERPKEQLEEREVSHQVWVRGRGRNHSVDRVAAVEAAEEPVEVVAEDGLLGEEVDGHGLVKVKRGEADSPAFGGELAHVPGGAVDDSPQRLPPKLKRVGFRCGDALRDGQVGHTGEPGGEEGVGAGLGRWVERGCSERGGEQVDHRLVPRDRAGRRVATGEIPDP